MVGKYLLILTPAIKTPSYRYRIAQYIPYLQKAGFETKTAEVAKVTPEDLGQLKPDFERASAIFLQKKLLTRTEAILLSPWKNKIAFDFDDAVFLPAFNKAGGISGAYKRWRRHRKFLRTLCTSAFIICANDYLAAAARKFGFDATVIPTPVPLEHYHTAPVQRQDDVFTIGWIGLGSNLRYLDLIRPVLKILNEKIPIALKVISSEPPTLTECPVIFKPWRLGDEADDLATLDVGIMPLTDDAWTRGKAAFKILQYMAAGLPIVCSDVGMNREVIRNGENGFLVKSAGEWAEILLTLARDEDLRHRTGQKGRETVARKYSLEIIAPRIVDAISNFIQKNI